MALDDKIEPLMVKLKKDGYNVSIESGSDGLFGQRKALDITVLGVVDDISVSSNVQKALRQLGENYGRTKVEYNVDSRTLKIKYIPLERKHVEAEAVSSVDSRPTNRVETPGSSKYS